MRKIFTGLCFLLFNSAVNAVDTATVLLDIKGMDCASCPLTVKVALRKIPGVAEVEVDYKSQSAKVRFNPAQTQTAVIAKTVTDMGYTATVRK